MPTLVALLVCLIPTTIGALLAAIGIAGMDRALRANIIAKSGKAVEVAGDVDTLLLDKTGTITVGNRRATQFVPFDGYTADEVGQLAAQASAADETPEGKSIVDLFHSLAARTAADRHARLGRRPPTAWSRRARGSFAFTAQTRMSGVDLPDGRRDSQRGAGRDHRHVASGRTATVPADWLEQPVAEWPAKGPRRCWSAKGTGSPAWWCWKTSSSRESPSGSSGCGGWGCGP